VRLWRRSRFSTYRGGGVGFEHDRQASRFRPILARDDAGQPVLGSEFTAASSTKAQRSLALRAGIIISLSDRVVARSGNSYLRRYADERGSKGVEAGIASESGDGSSAMFCRRRREITVKPGFGDHPIAFDRGR